MMPVVSGSESSLDVTDYIIFSLSDYGVNPQRGGLLRFLVKSENVSSYTSLS